MAIPPLPFHSQAVTYMLEHKIVKLIEMQNLSSCFLDPSILDDGKRKLKCEGGSSSYVVM